MIAQIFTCDHRIYDLPVLLSWNVTHTGSVPCDCFTVSFLYRKEMAEALEKAAGFLAWDRGQIMLKGIVDEYAVELGSEGLTAAVAGRGYAARLLDNESRPVTYQEATLAEIIRSHVEPYGISCRAAAEVRASSVYTVAAGTSQWKALDGFCRTYGGFSPRFSRDGFLLAVPDDEDARRLSIGDGDPVLSCVLREDHYGVLTEALVIDKTRNVSYSVKNQERINKGGQCRRVIYTPGQSTWAAMRYTGEYQIERSREEERSVTLTMPGSFLAFPGDLIHLELERMGLRGEFRVAEAENVFSGKGGAAAALTLRQADSI